MTTPARLRDLAAAAAGGVLGAAARLAGHTRPAAKPLHPHGEVWRARWHRPGLDPGVGVDLLDRPGPVDVLVRVSRAVGLPGPLPDVWGLAVRVSLPGGGSGDLLFAHTGRGRLSRFVLTGAREPGGRPMTTLLPYRAPTGALLLGARVGLRQVAVECSTASGGWRSLGDIELLEAVGDPTLAFDPVRHRIPGLEVPGWVARLRAPAYAGARRSRGQRDAAGGGA